MRLNSPGPSSPYLHTHTSPHADVPHFSTQTADDETHHTKDPFSVTSISCRCCVDRHQKNNEKYKTTMQYYKSESFFFFFTYLCSFLDTGLEINTEQLPSSQTPCWERQATLPISVLHRPPSLLEHSTVMASCRRSSVNLCAPLSGLLQTRLPVQVVLCSPAFTSRRMYHLPSQDGAYGITVLL